MRLRATLLFTVCTCSFLGLPPYSDISAQSRTSPARVTPAVSVETDVEEASLFELTPVGRSVSVHFVDVPLIDALNEIAAEGGVHLIYSPKLIPAGQLLTISLRDTPAIEAIRRALAGQPVRMFSSRNMVVLVRDRRRQPTATVEERPLVGVVTGQVTDAATGAALASASVVIEGTDRGDLTDAAGRFRIEGVPSGRQRVSAMRIGYGNETREVEVSDDGVATVDFALELAPTRLEELVVTATGEQRRVEIGNAIGRIEADSLMAAAPVTSLSDLVNARVPGAQVILLNGMTGSSPDIRIRGLNSLSVSNAPLFIVDGVRVNNQSTVGEIVDADPRTGFGQWGGRLNDLNPEEIESIEIVKGPSAATLYGTDAANGVVVITTKRGRTGPPSWTAYAEAGIVEPAESFLDNYYSWGHDPAGNIRQCLLVDAATDVCAIDSLTTFNPLENPRTSPIGTGFRRQLGAQVRGGADRFTYFVSAEHERETGYFELPEAERARLMDERGATSIPDEQIRPNWAEKLSLRANTGASFGSVELLLTNGLVLGNNQIPSPRSITSPGEFGQGYENPATFGGWREGRRPGETFSVRNTERFSRYTGSLSGNWRAANWLTARAVVGLDLANAHLDALQRNGEGPDLQTYREGRRQNTRSTTALYSVDLGASATFDLRPDVSSRTSVGFQFNERSDQVTSVTADILPPGSETITGASSIRALEQNNETVVAGAYLEQRMGFNDRLFLTGAVRFDGGSSFGQDFKTAVYPKASVSWLALDEAPDRWLNTLRLRAAYGASGVQPGATAALTLYEVFTGYVNGTNTAAARPNTIGNADLKPERQTELEVGADATFYDGRISVEATYYNRLSKDALIERPLPPDVGVASRWENIGSVRNSGVEGSIFAQVIESAPFSWDVSLNGSINHNKLEELGLDVPSVGFSTVQHREGYPLFGRWAIPIRSYDDANGNSIIEPDEVTYGDEEVYLGPSIAPRQLTVSTGVTLFDNLLRISSLFDYRGGFAQVNTNEINRCSALIGNCRAVNDPTTPLWEQARIVSFQHTNFGGTWAGFLEDASFTRWRELSFSINVPERLFGLVGARSAVLTLTGRNIALFTDYTGKDPEVSSSPGSPSGQGYSDNPTVPQSRYWILRLTFGL